MLRESRTVGQTVRLGVRTILGVLVCLTSAFSIVLPGDLLAVHAAPAKRRASSSRAFLTIGDRATLEAVTESVEKAGGRVLHAFPPSALIVDLPAHARHLEGVRAIFRHSLDDELIDSLDKSGRRAAHLWNGLLSPASTLDASGRLTGIGEELVGDALVPPRVTSVGPQANVDAGDPTPQLSQTSEYMIGRVAVGIVIPESDGQVDASTEDWTQDELDLVLAGFGAAPNWWSELDPRADLTFVYDDGTTSPIPTRYEPIEHAYTEHSLWIKDVMANKGYDQGSQYDQVRQYNNDLREKHGTDWAFTIFVVDSSNDEDNRFTDGMFAYAYLGGPFAVLTSGSNGYGSQNLDVVAAHEIGHIFFALDQYSAARQPCTRESGYLGVENQNSQYGDCPSDEPSLMRGQVYPFREKALDQYARGQIGWRDSDGDGIFDPVDTTITISSEYVTSVVQSNVFSFTGRVREDPYPSPQRESVTINRIERVEYRIDGADWADAEPLDGEFDSHAEAFAFSTPPLPTGDQKVELRVIDSAGNLRRETLAVVAAVDPAADAVETVISRVAPQGMDQRPAGVTYRGRATTLETTVLAGVFYRIDEGEWRGVEADDGAFDESEEEFSLTLSLKALDPGDHRIEVYAKDEEGRIDTSPAVDLIDVPDPPQRVFLPLLVATSPSVSSSPWPVRKIRLVPTH